MVVRTVTSPPGTRLRSGLTTTSTSRSPRVLTRIAYDPGMAEERERGRSDRMRSFVIGGVLGASAALATARRRSRPQRSRPTPAGLAAFESAPCYRELAERDAADRESPAGTVRTGPTPAGSARA